MIVSIERQENKNPPMYKYDLLLAKNADREKEANTAIDPINAVGTIESSILNAYVTSGPIVSPNDNPIACTINNLCDVLSCVGS